MKTKPLFSIFYYYPVSIWRWNTNLPEGDLLYTGAKIKVRRKCHIKSERKEISGT
jgi:hypothetical protein